MKKFLIVLLMLALIFALAGCGKDPYEQAENPIATITMENGDTMRFELQLKTAPNTVANFTELANAGFYDGLEFFRVMPGVLIQAGCPNNDGTGNAGWTIRGEFEKNGVKNDISHNRGVISMARIPGEDKHNTASSQFFIMQGNFPEYDGEYAAFGAAMDGDTLSVLDKIANRAVDVNNVPMVRQKIETIRVNTHGWVLDAVTVAIPKEDPTEEPVENTEQKSLNGG